MTKNFFIQAMAKFFAGVILVGALLFLPAGTFAYKNAWLFMGILFVPMFIAGVVMMFKNPALLKSRLSAKEKQSGQSALIKISGLMFLIGFILAGLDRRFGWTHFPAAVPIIAAALFLIAYILYAEVLRENAYLSRTIEVQEGQKVIDTGLYGVVRHPMYSATLILFLSMPLVLGSIPSFIVFLAYPAIIVSRLKKEEAFLEEELPSYRQYKHKVKYRLIPFIW